MITAEELNKDLPYGATPYTDDISGLKIKIPIGKQLTRKDVFDAEAENIRKAIMFYLTDIPDKNVAPFDLSWMLQLHEEMFGDVWAWAGTPRKTELTLGVEANKIFHSLKYLCDDIEYWQEHNSFDILTIAVLIHYHAVRIHPFANGNGRWSRMLANIYLMQRGEQPVKWNENSLAQDNRHRKDYIDAIKKCDQGDFESLIKMHEVRYEPI